MPIPCRFGLVAVFVLAVVVVHWQTHLSGRTVDAATAFVLHELPRNVSGLPPLPPTAAPPTAHEPSLPVFTVSGQDRPSSVDEGPRRVDHLFGEEFVGQAAAEFARGDRLLAYGDVNGAILAYMSAEEHHGQNSAALQNMIGRVYQKLGNHRSAEHHFNISINISDNPVIRWNRAASLLKLRRCVPAVEDAEWLLEADDSPLPDSSTHFAAHFVMTKCHEPDLSRAGWDRVNRKPEVVFEDDDEGVVKVSSCHTAFDHWDDGMFVPCANGWRDDGNKAAFHTHTQAALKMVEDGDFSDDMVAYFHDAAWAYLSLKAVLPEPEEPEPCFNPQSSVGTEITDGMRAREYLNESRRLRGLPPLRPLWGHRTVEERWDAQRAYELVTLGMLVEAACRDRRGPRYIEDLMRRMEALSGS